MEYGMWNVTEIQQDFLHWTENWAIFKFRIDDSRIIFVSRDIVHWHGKLSEIKYASQRFG